MKTEIFLCWLGLAFCIGNLFQIWVQYKSHYNKNISFNEMFEVDGKKYMIVRPETASQTDVANDHGHIVITLIEI